MPVSVQRADPARHSVIIPTSSRPDLLQRSLEALLEAERPGWTCEILVVDNSPEESVRDNARIVGSFGSPDVRLVRVAPKGSTAARHEGVRVASGDVLSFVDDDSLVSKGWLRGVENAFSHSAVSFVGGPVLPAYETDPPPWLSYLWTHAGSARYLDYLSLLDNGDEPGPISALLVFGCNMSIRRTLFFEARGMHPDIMPAGLELFRGDGESALSLKVEALGHHAYYAPDCGIQHVVSKERMTPDYFRKRAYELGIEESYAEVRAGQGLGPAGVTGVRRGWVGRMAHRSLERLTRVARGKTGEPAPTEPAEVRDLRESMRRCFAQGHDAHALAVHDDPGLLAFNLLADYLDPSVWDALPAANAAIPDSRSC
jgi:hypothetical protein